MWTVCEKGPSMRSACKRKRRALNGDYYLQEGGRGPWMWKWEMKALDADYLQENRALDADYLQVGVEGPGCRLFASWRRGPWTRIICKLEKRALDAVYLQVEEEGPGLFAKSRKGHGCGVVREKGVD
jgi:hypothetical protein